MNAILIILCGILMGAINLGFFMFGYYIHSKKPNDEGITVTQQNKEFIEEMLKWRNYGGRE